MDNWYWVPWYCLGKLSGIIHRGRDGTCNFIVSICKCYSNTANDSLDISSKVTASLVRIVSMWVLRKVWDLTVKPFQGVWSRCLHRPASFVWTWPSLSLVGASAASWWQVLRSCTCVSLAQKCPWGWCPAAVPCTASVCKVYLDLQGQRWCSCPGACPTTHTERGKTKSCTWL